MKPIMTYTVETRIDTTRTQKLLELAEMTTLRKVTSKTVGDGMKSQEIKKNIRNRRE